VAPTATGSPVSVLVSFPVTGSIGENIVVVSLIKAIDSLTLVCTVYQLKEIYQQKNK